MNTSELVQPRHLNRHATIYVRQSRLNQSISYRWPPILRTGQRTSLVAAWLRDVNPSNRLRSIRSRSQDISLLPNSFGKMPFKLHYRNVIDSRCLVASCDLLKSSKQVSFRKHLIHQSKPLVSFHSRNKSRQHANCPDTRFGTTPQGVRRSGLLSQGCFASFGLRQ